MLEHDKLYKVLELLQFMTQKRKTAPAPLENNTIRRKYKQNKTNTITSARSFLNSSRGYVSEKERDIKHFNKDLRNTSYDSKHRVLHHLLNWGSSNKFI